VAEYLLGDPRLRRNGSSNIIIGNRALIPHKGSLNEAVELRELESSSLLLLRYTILGALSSSSPGHLLPWDIELVIDEPVDEQEEEPEV
jgi:hypothetical protein